MPKKVQKKSKKSKEPKHKPVTQQSLDEIEESILLGEDLPSETVTNVKTRKLSIETSLLEEELLGESPVVVKKSKRRKTKGGSVSKPEKVVSEKVVSEKVEKVSDLEISLNVSEKDDSFSPKGITRSSTLVKTPEYPLSDSFENIKTDESKVVKSKKDDVVEKESKSSEKKTKLEKLQSPVQEKEVKSEKVELETKVKSERVLEPVPVPIARHLEMDEVDIYSDLSTDNIESHTPEGGEEVTLDEVFKMNKKTPEKQPKRVPVHHDPLSENEDDDLDYEEEDDEKISQMKISVLVGGSKEKKAQKTTSDKKTLPTLSQIPAPVILPPLPHTHITIPPMLPLPPVLPQPPRYPPPAYAPTHIKERRTIYINPKFRTEVILKNLEEQGIIKGGTMAVHMNRNRIRSRSRSPIKLHTNFEYVPSPKHKQRLELDDPTTTLLITDLSVCTTRSRIRELFSSVGNVKEVLTYPAERRAVVTFEHAKDAVVCRRKFHRSVVDGSCMTVNFAI